MLKTLLNKLLPDSRFCEEVSEMLIVVAAIFGSWCVGILEVEWVTLVGVLFVDHP